MWCTVCIWLKKRIHIFECRDIGTWINKHNTFLFIRAIFFFSWLFLWTRNFTQAQWKYYTVFESQDLDGQFTSKFLEIFSPRNSCPDDSIVSFVNWGVVLQCVIWTKYSFRKEILCKIRHIVDPMNPFCFWGVSAIFH